MWAIFLGNDNGCSCSLFSGFGAVCVDVCGIGEGLDGLECLKFAVSYQIGGLKEEGC